MGDKPVCPSNQVTNRSSFLWLGKPGEDGLPYRKASGPIDEEQKGKEKEESGLRKRPLLSGNDSDFQKERMGNPLLKIRFARQRREIDPSGLGPKVPRLVLCDFLFACRLLVLEGPKLMR